MIYVVYGRVHIHIPLNVANCIHEKQGVSGTFFVVERLEELYSLQWFQNISLIDGLTNVLAPLLSTIIVDMCEKFTSEDRDAEPDQRLVNYVLKLFYFALLFF